MHRVAGSIAEILGGVEEVADYLTKTYFKRTPHCPREIEVRLGI